MSSSGVGCSTTKGAVIFGVAHVSLFNKFFVFVDAFLKTWPDLRPGLFGAKIIFKICSIFPSKKMHLKQAIVALLSPDALKAICREYGLEVDSRSRLALALPAAAPGVGSS